MKEIISFPLLGLLFWWYLFFQFISSSYGLNILLFGDSVDRLTTISWCKFQEKIGMNITEMEWGELYLRSHRIKLASWYCNNSKDSIAFAHFIGSRDTGPYYNDVHSTPAEPYLDTINRTVLAFNEYYKLFGAPDYLYLNYVNWDVQHINKINKTLIPYSTIWWDYINEFEHNNRKRIDQIKSILQQNQTILALRTSISTKATKEIAMEMNHIVRKLAFEYQLLLYDFELDALSSIHYKRSIEWQLLLDFIHPRGYYTILAAEKMLFHRYSTALIFYNSPNTTHLELTYRQKLFQTAIQHPIIFNIQLFLQPIVFFGIPTSNYSHLLNSLPLKTNHFSIDSHSSHFLSNFHPDFTHSMFSHVYLYNKLNQTIHLIQNHSETLFFSLLRLGYCDIFPISKQQLTEILVVDEPIQPIYKEPFISLSPELSLNMTPSYKMFYLMNTYNIPNKYTINAIIQIVGGIEPTFQRFYYLVPPNEMFRYPSIRGISPPQLNMSRDDLIKLII